MSGLVPVPGTRVYSAVICFQLHGEYKSFPFAQAQGYAAGLLASASKASLVFTNVVASRMTVGFDENNNITWSHLVQSYRERQVDFDQFVEILNYPLNISGADWARYMEDIHTRAATVLPIG